MTRDPTLADGPRSPVAAIDVGTNSIHMVVARPVGDGDALDFEVIDKLKEPVRLGSGVGADGTLSEEAIGRGLAALSRMRAVADRHHATVRAVATSAVREAPNGAVFVDRAVAECGVSIEVITGLEEARLIFTGVSRSVATDPRGSAIIDIGGGSTEVVIARGPTIIRAESLQMGAVRFTEQFLAGVSGEDGPADVGRLDPMRTRIDALVSDIARLARAEGIRHGIVSSGTSEAVTRIIAARDGVGKAGIDGYRFSAAQLRTAVDAVLGCRTIAERTALEGVNKRRAEIITAGATILDRTVIGLGLDELTFSATALREGVLIDALSRPQ